MYFSIKNTIKKRQSEAEMTIESGGESWALVPGEGGDAELAAENVCSSVRGEAESCGFQVGVKMEPTASQRNGEKMGELEQGSSRTAELGREVELVTVKHCKATVKQGREGHCGVEGKWHDF